VPVIGRRGKCIAFQIGLAVFAGLCLAGNAGAERLPIKTYTTADGLPRDHINRIMQDSRGFIWLSTSEGLSRFDGYRFTNYGTEQGLADRHVNDFLETRGGTYWVATSNGLCRFIPDALPAPSGAPTHRAQRFVTYHPDQGGKVWAVRVLYEDRAGRIWCGTSAGLFRIEEVDGAPVFSFVDIVQPAPTDDKLGISAIIEDRRGSLWITAQSGLYRLRPDGAVERYTAEDGLSERYSRTLIEDGDGRIWVGSTLGLFQLVDDPKPHRPVVAWMYSTKDGLANNEVMSLCQSADGKLWIGTWMGLSNLTHSRTTKRAELQSYDRTSGLSDIEITALYQDRDGNLWIGSDSGGAMRLAANGLATYGEEDGVRGVRIASIFENLSRELCVISGYWLNVLSDGQGRAKFSPIHLTLPSGIHAGSWGWYQIMFEDSTGQWWMNTSEGLVRYPRLASTARITRARPQAVYTTKDGLPTNDVFRLFEDSRHDIWISTLGNTQAVLARWERATGTFHRYSPADGIPEAAPCAFCEDGSGNLWIGFYTGELVRYRDGRFSPVRMTAGALSGLVRGLYLDAQKRLWVATSDAGVACTGDPGAQEPVFRFYSMAEGMSSNQATCVTQDQWGMIYVGTGRGVDKLDPSTGRIRQLTMADGLPNSFVNVGFRDRDNSLWFGTLQGLSRLVPQPERPTPPPPILITALHIAGTDYPLPELGAANIAGPELGANQKNIQIDFSGLSLTAAESLRYQYKLEGAFSQWGAPSSERAVAYPNLAPGSYRFLVRAVSQDGTMSEWPAAVSFAILPPVWQRWWFRSIALIVIAIPIFAIVRSRRQRIRAARDAEEALQRGREERLAELERVRTRIATDLHDDIGSTLSQIYLLSEVARQRLAAGDETVAEPLALISDASHEVVDSMSDIVWAINPNRDHLRDLVHRMRRFASDIFSSCDIAFRFSAPDAESDVRLGADVRREVFLIFKESVNNLVKHSGCTEARIEFQMASQSILLVVSDNGKGFDPCKCTEGHGLMSLRERSKSIGGQLDLVSTIGAGTTVTLRMDLA
jgi:ligand-binding sensor domain-containing protein/signal transduction histidine kinase